MINAMRLEPLRKFLCLQPTRQNILLRSFFFLLITRLMMWLLPFKGVLQAVRILKSITTARSTGSGDPVPVETIAWSVMVASRYVPRNSCLIQALVASLLLKQLGHSACLRIGVARGAGEPLQAHAWVEYQGKILVGDSEQLSRFHPLIPVVVPNLNCDQMADLSSHPESTTTLV